MRCLLPFGLLVVVASAQAAPNFKRVVLPNGLTVLAVENRGSAVAGLHLGVRYDPAGIGPARAGVAALSQQVLQGQLRELLKQEPWEQLGQQLRGTRAGLVANTECDYCEIRGHVTDDMLPQAVQLAGRMLLGQQPVKPEDLQAAREAGIPVVVVNQGPTRADDLAAVRLDAPLGATLAALVPDARATA